MFSYKEIISGMNYRLLLICATLIIVVPSCTSIKTPGVITQLAAAPSPVISDLEYPSPDDAYPAPNIQHSEARNNRPQLIPFRLDKPVMSDATQVSGTGPPGVPIVLADITYNGEVLGQGWIDNEGTYRINLIKPLQNGHRIGIALDELEDTEWNSADFLDPGFFGDEFQQVPLLTFFYDTTQVISP